MSNSDRTSTINSPVTIAPSDKTNNPLTTLIHRLEAATSRLEDIAHSATTFETSVPQQHQSNTSLPVPSPNAGIQASSSAPDLPTTASKNASSQPQKPSAPEVPPTVAAMDDLIKEHVSAFLNAAQALDNPLITTQAESVGKAFADQRRFLLTTTRAKKPDMQSPATFKDLLQDLQQDMGAVGDIRDSNRGSQVKDHLAMVGEGVGALQWLLMEGKGAGDFAGEVLGGSQMYGNRVLKEWREK